LSSQLVHLQTKWIAMRIILLEIFFADPQEANDLYSLLKDCSIDETLPYDAVKLQVRVLATTCSCIMQHQPQCRGDWREEHH
jgi:hypothetical protein